MPGLLRAGRRLRPGVGVQTTARARRRRVGDHRPEGVDVAGARGRLVLRAGPHRAGLASGTPGCPTCSCRWTSPASRSGPIVQLTGGVGVQRGVLRRRPHRARTSSSARSAAAGASRWRTLAFERGAATLGQQLGVPARAGRARRAGPRTGALDDPVLRERLARRWIGLEVMRLHALRTDRRRPRRASVDQARLGALAPRRSASWRMDVLGAAGMVARRRRRARPSWQRLFLFSRADTIYGGSNEIQRNIIAERVLGLPREARRVSTSPPTGPRAAGRQGRRGHGRGRHRHRLRGGPALPRGGRARSWSATGTSAAWPTRPTRWPTLRRGRARDRRATSPTRRRCRRCSTGAVATYGRLDVVVNNAGLGGTRSVLEMTDDQWSRVLDVTLNGTFRCTRAALRQMVAQGGGGAVVNNASVVGWRAQEGQAHYAAAKAGRHGADPLRGDGRRRRTASGSTRWRRASPCTRSWRR